MRNSDTKTTTTLLVNRLPVLRAERVSCFAAASASSDTLLQFDSSSGSNATFECAKLVCTSNESSRRDNRLEGSWPNGFRKVLLAHFECSSSLALFAALCGLLLKRANLLVSIPFALIRRNRLSNLSLARLLGCQRIYRPLDSCSWERNFILLALCANGTLSEASQQ